MSKKKLGSKFEFWEIVFKQLVEYLSFAFVFFKPPQVKDIQKHKKYISRNVTLFMFVLNIQISFN